MATRRSFGKQLLTAGALALAAGPSRLLRAQAAPGAFTGTASLKAHAAARGLYVGTAVNTGLLARDAAYARTIAEQYNIVVAENAMKWAALRPGPDTFDFADADRFVQFAETHGMAIRGHNLCWHQALPSWFAATVNKGNAQHYLTTHIQSVVTRYKGKIRAWDVVNEAIEPADNQPGGMRNSPWYKLLGPRYIDIAFRAARAADPHALLTYNDYGIETDTPADTAKRAAVLGLLTRLRHDGVPLDAAGIQSHLSAGSAKQIGPGLTAFVHSAAGMGLKVFLTELDVNDDAIPADAPADRGQQVAAIYRDYVTLLIKNPAVTDILTWGVSNRSSWLNAKGSSSQKFRPKHPQRTQECLPFHDDDTPSPAFYALRDAIDTRQS